MTDIHLSPRETQVLQGIAEGLTTEYIAFTLGISRKTVENYKAALMAKLGVQSIAAAVAIAVQTGAVVVPVMFHITVQLTTSSSGLQIE